MESYEKSMNESEGNIPEKSRNFHRKEFVRGTPSGIPRRILSYVPSLATFLVELIEGFPMKLLEDWPMELQEAFPMNLQEMELPEEFLRKNS